jgi:excisionase family DNA binding protein
MLDTPVIPPTRILLRVHEAAEMLGLSRATLYNLLAAGTEIPVVRIGRSVRIPRAELEEWITRQTTDWRTTPPPAHSTRR